MSAAELARELVERAERQWWADEPWQGIIAWLVACLDELEPAWRGVDEDD